MARAIIWARGLISRFVLQLRIAALYVRSRFVRSTLIEPAGPIVSMTSHGHRIRSVYLTIESIARGKLLPSRLILWIDDEKALCRLPAPLKRLQKRGLEVRQAANYGPHTKYYPYVEASETFDTPLVTADDDMLYPQNWLAGLVTAFTERPDVINCYRARLIALQDSGLGKYAEWNLCQSTDASFRNFATGVSGVIYPPQFLIKLKIAGLAFKYCCPNQDDVWLHAQALRAGYMTRQIVPNALFFITLPGTQKNSLQTSNVHAPLPANDRQVALTYNETDLRILRDGVSAS